MSDERRKIIERYAGRPPAPPVEDDPQEDEVDYQPAAPVSGNRRPEIMLEFRLKTGDSLALGYALLLSAVWNRSEGIVLEFTTHRIDLAGRNLRHIYRAIVSHRLAYVRELNSPSDDLPDESVVVTTIKVTPL
ncbi:MAG: hypothetical protein WCH39_30105 [Schlesneria sp.]